jgi:hypothetical protein
MMPNRDTLTGINTVVWGVTTQANGVAYTMNFGDGTIVNGNVVDRSYIAFDHTYALANTYTATLTIGAESASVQIQAFSAATLSAFDLRGVNINRAIEDALRYLWVNQLNRAANFPAGTTTAWTNIVSYPGPAAGPATLAFENHGYRLSGREPVRGRRRPGSRRRGGGSVFGFRGESGQQRPRAIQFQSQQLRDTLCRYGDRRQRHAHENG